MQRTKHGFFYDAGAVDVKRFGAKGDGVTDDTNAIHAAIASLDEGCALLFPTGLYLVSSIVLDKNISLIGLGSWGVNGATNGANITSSTSSVPVLEITSAATSHWKHQNIRFIANSNSTACITVDTANNGARFERCFFKGNSCPTALTIGAGARLDVVDCYSTTFSDVNYTNNGVSRLYVSGGLNDVGTNAFVKQSVTGGNLYIRDAYLEWSSGSRSIVMLNNTSSPSSVFLDGITQTSIAPYAMVRQAGNVGVPAITVDGYNGSSPTYLYADDTSSARNTSWTSRMSSGLVKAFSKIVEVPIAPNSHWTQITSGTTSIDVSGGKFFRTANSTATTISGFSNGMMAQEVLLQINDANTTIDFTGTSLKGNAGVDYVAKQYDLIRCVYTGSVWLCDVSSNAA